MKRKKKKVNAKKKSPKAVKSAVKKKPAKPTKKTVTVTARLPMKKKSKSKPKMKMKPATAEKALYRKKERECPQIPTGFVIFAPLDGSYLTTEQPVGVFSRDVENAWVFNTKTEAEDEINFVHFQLTDCMVIPACEAFHIDYSFDSEGVLISKRLPLDQPTQSLRDAYYNHAFYLRAEHENRFSIFEKAKADVKEIKRITKGFIKQWGKPVEK